MKRIYFTMAFFALFATACTSNKAEEHEHDHGTHQHEDGAVHENHEEETQEIQQEEFDANTKK